MTVPESAPAAPLPPKPPEFGKAPMYPYAKRGMPWLKDFATGALVLVLTVGIALLVMFTFH